MNHAEKVIHKAGGVEAVASELNITINAVYAWQRNGFIPLGRARAIAKMGGMTPEYVAKRPIP
jgi:hypothetical protein